MQLNRGDIIRDKEEMLSVACVLGSTVYVESFKGRVGDKVPCYKIDDVSKHFKKVEIMRGKDAAGK